MSLAEQNYEMVAINALRPHPDNPRKGDVAVIHESINANGFYGAVIVQSSTHRIIAGEHRWLAAQDAGMTHVPAIVLDVDDETARRILLADNRANDLATYDTSALAELLTDIVDLTGTGFTDADLAALVPPDLDGDALLDDDSEPPPTGSTPRPGDIYSSDRVSDEAFSYFRKSGFPYRNVPVYESMLAINALAHTDDAALERTSRACTVADSYCHHRWDVHADSKPSPLETFNRDDRLRGAIEMAHQNGALSNRYSILGILGLYRGTQTARNFRPGFALKYMRKFCPDDGTILDTSMGFGGRLVGFFASSAAHYVGIDPAVDTYHSNRRLVDELCPPDKTCELHNVPAEDFDVDPIRGRCDFALTSPPYFDRERYSNEDTQSWKRYSTLERWVDNFLVPTCQLQHDALRPGAHSVIVINDVKPRDGSPALPLTDLTISAATSVGFEHISSDGYAIKQHFHPDADKLPDVEPTLIFRKREVSS